MIWYVQLATCTLVETNFLHKEDIEIAALQQTLDLRRFFICSNLDLI